MFPVDDVIMEIIPVHEVIMKIVGTFHQYQTIRNTTKCAYTVHSRYLAISILQRVQKIYIARKCEVLGAFSEIIAWTKF